MHSINLNPPETHNCMLCANFERQIGPNSVQCRRFGVGSPAREMQCVFWTREPGADDEDAPEFWREVMHRRFPPPPPPPPLKRRTPEETRAIMGPNYNPNLPWDAPRKPPRVMDEIDLEDEAEALAESLGPLGIADPTSLVSNAPNR